MSKIWTDYFKPGKILLLIVGMLASVIGVQLFVVIRILGFASDGRMVQVTVEGALLIGSYLVTVLAMLLLISEYYRVKTKIGFYEKIVDAYGVPGLDASDKKSEAEPAKLETTPVNPVKDPLGFIRGLLKSKPDESKPDEEKPLFGFLKRKPGEEPSPGRSPLTFLQGILKKGETEKPVEPSSDKPSLLDDAPQKPAEKPGLLDGIKARLAKKESVPAEPKKQDQLAGLKEKLNGILKRVRKEPEARLPDESPQLVVKNVKLDEPPVPASSPEPLLPQVKEKKSSLADLLGTSVEIQTVKVSEVKAEPPVAAPVKTAKGVNVDALMKTAAESLLAAGSAPKVVPPRKKDVLPPVEEKVPAPAPVVSKGEPIKAKVEIDDGAVKSNAGASETLSMDNLLDFSPKQPSNEAVNKYKTMSVKVEEDLLTGDSGGKLDLEASLPEPASEKNEKPPEASIDPQIIADSEFLKVLNELNSVVTDMKSRKRVKS